jgi:hypothetical protein
MHMPNPQHMLTSRSGESKRLPLLFSALSRGLDLLHAIAQFVRACTQRLLFPQQTL